MSMDVAQSVEHVQLGSSVAMTATTEQERLEEELAELRKLTRCKTLEKCPDPQWKLIRDETIEYKGDTFHRKLWVAVCGGAVEYTETLTPEGERSYVVERFELKPESWAKEKVIAHPCSQIVSDTYDHPMKAMDRVDFHRESIKPFWWKVEKEESKMEELTLVTEAKEYEPGYGNPETIAVGNPESGEHQGSIFHTLMLHAVAEMYGPGGLRIVVDEAKARATPCSCIEYKPGKYWCTSKGVIGVLTDEQEKIFCNPREIIERPDIKERLTEWAEAVEFCRGQLPPTDGQTRLEIYLDCMSKKLTKAGIED